MKVFYNSQPAKFETVGDGSFYYRWNIQQYGLSDSGNGELTGDGTCLWECDEVLVWAPLTVDKVIDAVIHSKYSIAEELAIVNNYVEYQNSSVAGPDAVAKYVEYISFVANSRTMVMKDFEESAPVEPVTTTMLLNSVVKFVSMTVNSQVFSDKDALSIKSVYPQWESYIGKTVTKGMKLQHNNKLWKVLQEHTVQEQYKPGTGTESLYTEVAESDGDTEVGTLDNPIPYSNNMELEEGKYYSQGGVSYKCTRSTGQPVYNPLSELVGIYVEIAQ